MHLKDLIFIIILKYYCHTRVFAYTIMLIFQIGEILLFRKDLLVLEQRNILRDTD